MSVANVEIDLYQYPFNHFDDCWKYEDYQVTSEYISARSYYVIVTRLDKDSGWTRNLRVLQYHQDSNSTHIIQVGTSDTWQKKVLVEVDFDLLVNDSCTTYVETYRLPSIPEPQSISRERFNELFDTNIVVLPHDLYAVGFQDGQLYMYNEAFASYFEIIHSINFMVRVGSTRLASFYFIISSSDGYFQGHWFSPRTVPQLIRETECKGIPCIHVCSMNAYPIFHRYRYILGQSILLQMDFTLPVIDRHFLYCNLYHHFRSIHCGIPFHQKKSRILFACRRCRGSPYNFTQRRDIQVNQRVFFDECVNKEYVDSPSWMEISEMVQYKYIIDVDGHASTWDATAWKLNSGSVIFKVDSCWEQYFYDEYRPWNHYVPIADDFHDLQEKFHWCETHPTECVRMIQNCKTLFQKVYRVTHLIKHCESVLYKAHGLPMPIYLDSERYFLCAYNIDVFHRKPLTFFKDVLHQLLNTDVLLFGKDSRIQAFHSQKIKHDHVTYIGMISTDEDYVVWGHVGDIKEQLIGYFKDHDYLEDKLWFPNVLNQLASVPDIRILSYEDLLSLSAP